MMKNLVPAACAFAAVILMLSVVTDGAAQEAPANNTTQPVLDFKALKQQYLSQWEDLGFQSSFDTFVEDGSVQGYGVYKEHPSNIFGPGDTITLYVEPIGYGFDEGVDREGNTLYSYNISASIILSTKQGTQITPQPIPTELDKPLNSHDRDLQAFIPIPFPIPPETPVGEYTITYTITDGVSGESIDITKDVRVAQVME